jgi:hypothetical protein
MSQDLKQSNNINVKLEFQKYDYSAKNGEIKFEVSSDTYINDFKLEIIKPNFIDDLTNYSISKTRLVANELVALDNKIKINQETNFKIKGVISGRLENGNKIGVVKYLYFLYDGEKYVVQTDEEIINEKKSRLFKISGPESYPFNDLASTTSCNILSFTTSDSVIIKGKVQFLDSSHTQQNLIYGFIELVRKDPTYKILQQTSTDQNGNYRISVLPDSSITDKNLYIRVSTKGMNDRPSGSTGIVEVIDEVFKSPYYSASSIFTISPSFTGTINTDLLIDESVDWGVCAVFQHIVNGWILAHDQLGINLDKVVVFWPSSFSTFADTIRVLQGDRWDRDVVLHEYAHFVDAKYKISKLPGGDHFLDENLSNKYETELAKQLAWAEGFADFFSVALQYINTNDSYYDDREDVNIHYNLDGPVKHPGTDCEASVACILWDIFDTEDLKEPFDHVALGLNSVWKLVTTNGTFANVEKLKTYWEQNRTYDYNDFNSIYAQYTTLTPTFVDKKNNQEIPKEISISNYPNPFNSETTIQYTLTSDGFVELEIYNVLGQKVKTLISEDQNASKRYCIKWNGTGNNNITVPSGFYYGSLRTNHEIKITKFVLLK